MLVLSLETGCKWSSKSNYTSVLCRMIKKAPKTKSSLKSVDILTCIFSDERNSSNVFSLEFFTLLPKNCTTKHFWTATSGTVSNDLGIPFYHYHCVKDVCIRSFSAVFTLNVEKYGPEKLQIRTLFTQCIAHTLYPISWSMEVWPILQ